MDNDIEHVEFTEKVTEIQEKLKSSSVSILEREFWLRCFASFLRNKRREKLSIKYYCSTVISSKMGRNHPAALPAKSAHRYVPYMKYLIKMGRNFPPHFPAQSAQRNCALHEELN